MKKLIFALLFIAGFSFADLPVRRDYTNDVSERIEKRPLDLMQEGSFDLYWTFNQGTTPKDLSAATSVIWQYAPPDRSWTVSVTGSVDDATNGIVKVPITPAQLATNSVEDIYSWSLNVSGGGETLAYAYGDLDIAENLLAQGLTLLTNAVIDWSIVDSYLNGGSGPAIGDGSTVTWTTNANGQLVFSAAGGSSTTNTLAEVLAAGDSAGDSDIDLNTNDLNNVNVVKFIPNGGCTNAGSICASTDEDTLEYQTSIPGVKEQLGQELQTPSKLTTGDTMSNLDMAEIIGGSGDKPVVTNAAYAGADIFNILGLSTHDWDSLDGRVTSFGLVRSGNTEAISDAVGDRLYWSEGGLTNVQTGNAPFIGWVTRRHATDGTILVNPDQPETDPIWAGVSNNYYTSSEVDSTFLPLAGGTMNGDIDMGGNNITNANAISGDTITATNDAGGVKVGTTGEITGDGSDLTIVGGSDLILSFGDDVIIDAGDLRPNSSNTTDLGTTTEPFKELHVDTIEFNTPAITQGVLTLNGTNYISWINGSTTNLMPLE